MDIASVGLSLYTGSMDPPVDDQAQEDEEEAEEERQRQHEMKNLLANAFDDLEDSELQQSSYYPPGDQDGGDTERDMFSDVRANDPTGNVSRSFQVHENGGNRAKSSDACKILHGTGPVNGHPRDNYDDRRNNVYYGTQQNDPHPHYTRNNEKYQDINGQTGEYGEGNYGHESDRSVTPWSDRSNSITSSNYHHGADVGVNPEAMRLNLQENTDVSYDARGGQLITTSRDGSDSLMPLQQNLLGAGSPLGQLKLLYEARGRELDKMAAEIEQLRAEKLSQVSYLQHEVTLLKGEKDRLELSRSQSQILLTEMEGQMRSLRTDHQKTLDELTEVKADRTRLRLKLQTAESHIKTLEENISDLQSVDSLAKNRQMHEDFLAKLQSSHRDELKALHLKLSNADHALQDEKHRFMELQAELQLTREKHGCILMEKSRIIKELQSSLEASQQQCDSLLAANRASDSAKALREKIETLTEDKKQLEKELEIARAKWEERKEALENYDTALKLGVLSSVIPSDDSMAQLRIGAQKQLTYEDTLVASETEAADDSKPGASDTSLVRKLKEECQHNLLVIKHKRDRLEELSRELGEQTKTIRKLQAQLKSCQVDVDVHVSTIKTLTDENNKLSEQLSKARPECLSLKTVNSSLKEELASALRQVSVLLRSGNELKNVINSMEESSVPSSNYGELASLLINHRKAITQVENFIQIRWSELRKETDELVKDKFLWTERVGDIVATLDSLKIKICEMPNIDSNILKSLKDLFKDFKNHASQVREAQAALVEKYTTAQNDLWTVKLSLQKLENSDACNRNRIQELSDKLANEIQNGRKVLEDSLETSKRTYLKFHEDAIAHHKREFDVVRAKLEENIESLNKELTEVKALYVSVCKEKNELEKQLEGDSKDEDSGISSDRLRSAVNAVTSKYEKYILGLKQNHQQELLSIGQVKSVCSAEVQTSLVNTDDPARSLSSNSPISSNIPRAELNIVSPNAEEAEDSHIAVKKLGSQLNAINSKVSELIGGIQEGQVAKTQQITDSLESYRQKFLILERQIYAALTPEERGYTLSVFEDSFARETAEGIISEYKNTIAKLKLENKKLQESFEVRVRDLLQQVKLVSESNEKMMNEMANIQRQHSASKAEGIDVESIVESIDSLRHQMELMSKDHAEVVCRRDAEIKELNSSRNVEQLRFVQELNNLKEEKSLAKKEVDELNQELVSEREAGIVARNKLKDKFRRLQAYVEEVRNAADKRVDHYIKEAERVQREGDENRLKIFKCFQAYLDRAKDKLEDSVRLIIRACEENPSRDLHYVPKLARSILITLEELKLDESLLQPKVRKLIPTPGSKKKEAGDLNEIKPAA